MTLFHYIDSFMSEADWAAPAATAAVRSDAGAGDGASGIGG